MEYFRNQTHQFIDLKMSYVIDLISGEPQYIDGYTVIELDEALTWVKSHPFQNRYGIVKMDCISPVPIKQQAESQKSEGQEANKKYTHKILDM